MPDEPLPPGLYERLVTRAIEQKLLRFDTARVIREGIEPAEAPGTLARHVERVLERALDGLPNEERLTRQTEFTNRLIALLVEIDSDSQDEHVLIPPGELRAIRELTTGIGQQPDLISPLVPLSASDLLVNARDEPSLAANLAAYTTLKDGPTLHPPPGTRWQHPPLRAPST